MKNKYVMQLKSYLSQHFYLLILVFISLLAVSASLLLLGVFFREFIDFGLSTGKINHINSVIKNICLLIAIFAISSFCRSYFINLIALKVISKIKLDTYSNLLKIDYAKFESLKLGDVLSRLGTDLEQIKNLITNFLSFFIRNSVMLMGGLILMFMQSAKLTLIVLISLPVLLVPLIKLSKKVRELSRKSLEKNAEIFSNIEENFLGIQAVHAYNMQNNLTKKFSNASQDYVKLSSKRLFLRSLFFALAISCIAISIIAVIWVGSIDIVENKISSGQMVSFIYFAMIVGMSLGGISELFSEIQTPLSALERVFELKDITQGEHHSNNNENLYNNILQTDYKIKFKDLCFCYPSRPENLILNKINFSINKGEFIGLVGESGCGKSTILQLLLKFYQKESGNIYINNLDIESISKNNLRQKIAYVPQQPTIFSGTIAENIQFGSMEVSNKQLEKIADICGVSEFSNKLKSGLNTKIGQRGMRISGGQKQRIAIARALLYAPEILVLDEATSAIDEKGEKELLEQIRRCLKDKTIISVAHRISSLSNTDKIIVIDEGKVKAQGKHAELLNISEIYKTLYRK